MKLTRYSASGRWLLRSIVVLSVTIGLAFIVSSNINSGVTSAQNRPIAETTSAVFSNTTPITISDVGAVNGDPYPSTINVTGLTGNIAATPGSVKVTINNFSHTFNSDVIIALVGPGGQAIMLQGRAGLGDPETNVTYTISDTGAETIPDPSWGPGTYLPTNWATLATSFPAPGPGTTYANPGPGNSGTATLTSVYGNTAPNGNWSLYVRDLFDQDGGTIAGGWSLEITTTGGSVPTTHTISDFDGDGKTDFSVVRNTGGGSTGQITWFVSRYANYGAIVRQWGSATDTFLANDFDGDGLADFGVYRPTTQSTFYLIQSQTNTFRVENWGAGGDDPSVVGDYDNDGKADFAVYRAGAAPGAQSFFYWKSSNPSATLTSANVVAWGQNGDSPAPGDYDGDHKMDFAVQRPSAGTSVFYRRYSSGIADTVTTLGSANDYNVPGDYDGDGKTDLCVVGDAVPGFLQWTYRPSNGGPDVVDTWGVTTDYPAPGDYNGDGKADYAVWRPGSPSTFWIMTPVTRQIDTRQWGENLDVPVMFTYAH